MNEAIGTIVILLGQAIALVMRLWPNGGINPYIPRVVWVLNFVGILAGFAEKLLRAIGPVAWMESHSELAAAGVWGSLLAVAKIAASVFLASGLLAVQRWIYEQGTKPAIPKAMLDAGEK